MKSTQFKTLFEMLDKFLVEKKQYEQGKNYDRDNKVRNGQQGFSGSKV